MKSIQLSFDSAILDKLSEKEVEIIKDSFDKAVQVCFRKLGSAKDGELIKVVIADDPRLVIPEGGVGGRAVHKGLVKIAVSPRGVKGVNVFSSICHELNHVFRYRAFPDFDGRLAAAIVFEGLAVAFEEEVLRPMDEASFFLKTMMERKNSDKLLKKVQKDLFKQDYDFEKNYTELFFTGSAVKGLPRWAGYEIGYFAVKSHMAKTGKRASELIDEKVDNFFS